MGVDVVEVRHLAQLIAQDGLSGVLTEPEMSYCNKRHLPAQHIAARFAAKEAVLKALGTGVVDGICWTDVEVINEGSGQPTVSLHGRAAAIASKMGLRALALSLSHTAELAIAQVVATWAPL